MEDELEVDLVVLVLEEVVVEEVEVEIVVEVDVVKVSANVRVLANCTIGLSPVVVVLSLGKSVTLSSPILILEL